MKKRIVLSTYNGFPDRNVGGPNKVVFEMLNSESYVNFDYLFVSESFQYNFQSTDDIINYKSAISSSVKLGNSLYNQQKIYRKIVQHPIYLRYFRSKARKKLKKKSTTLLNYDLFHAHDVYSYRCLYKSRVPSILSIHSKGPIIQELVSNYGSSKILKQYITNLDKDELKILDYTDFITFPSYAAMDLFCELKGIGKKSNFRVVYNGIDIKYIESVKPINFTLGLPYTPDIKILSVSEHTKEKNIDKLILSIQVLKEKYSIKPYCIIVGKGYLTDSLRKIVEEKKLKEEIYFVPFLNNDEIIGLMKACDIFLMTSENVVFDMVILEALASGTTIIANNKGGNKEIIKNGINGYLFEELTPDYIAQIIFSSRKISYEKIYNSILPFSVSQMSENYHNIYRELI